MGASYVAGTAPGLGAANGGKGPGNERNQYVPLLSPHVVAAGYANLTGTTITVTLASPLAGGYAKYGIFLTNAEANTTVAQVTARTDSGGNFVSFQITTASGKDVFWMVVKLGNN
jgi:hypothetical protein